MNSLITFIFLGTAMLVVQALRLDPGPQTFPDKSSEIQKPQKRYATKEVIVYLTPSQIKALREGKGYLNAQSSEATEAPEEDQEEVEQPQIEDGEEIFQLRPIEEDEQSLEEEDNEEPDVIPVEEPNTEDLDNDQIISWIYGPEENLQIYSEGQTQTDTQIDSQENQDEESEETEQIPPKSESPKVQKFKLIPYESATEKTATPKVGAKEQLFRERWLRLLEKNRAQLKKAFPATEQAKTAEQPSNESENPLSRLRYSSKYNDQKQAIELEELRRKNSQKSQASVNLLRKEVSITKHQQQPIIKHVRVKVPTPVLVPVPEPFEVKVPHPYPVPLEVFKQVPSAKTKKNENKKSSSAENEKRASTPVNKKGSVSTADSERTAPSESKRENPVEVTVRKPDRVTIIRHTWEN